MQAVFSSSLDHNTPPDPKRRNLQSRNRQSRQTQCLSFLRPLNSPLVTLSTTNRLSSYAQVTKRQTNWADLSEACLSFRCGGGATYVDPVLGRLFRSLEEHCGLVNSGHTSIRKCVQNHTESVRTSTSPSPCYGRINCY